MSVLFLKKPGEQISFSSFFEETLTLPVCATGPKRTAGGVHEKSSDTKFRSEKSTDTNFSGLSSRVQGARVVVGPRVQLGRFCAAVILVGAALGLRLLYARMDVERHRMEYESSWLALAIGGLAFILSVRGNTGSRVREFARSGILVWALGAVGAAIGLLFDFPSVVRSALSPGSRPTSFWLLGGVLGMAAGSAYLSIVAANRRRSTSRIAPPALKNENRR